MVHRWAVVLCEYSEVSIAMDLHVIVSKSGNGSTHGCGAS